MKYAPGLIYAGAQIVISSDRVVLHSDNDAVLLFGKAAVGLSSVGRVNIDTKQGTTINAPEIELGLYARTKGEPVTKADTTVRLLRKVLTNLATLSRTLQGISNPGTYPAIIVASQVLETTCNSVKSALEEIKSTTTFTR
jgi:hypothetical protein